MENYAKYSNKLIMNRRLNPYAFALIFIGICSLVSCKNELEEARPNVIVIMTDDQGYGDIAAHGNPIIRTPHLDKLHSESYRFTDFHVNSFCAPTRAALITGRMSDRTHVHSTVYLRNHLNIKETTMAEFFKASGYNTGHFGKWHIGANYPYRPIDRGFDDWVGIGDGGLGEVGEYWGNDRMNDTYIRNGKWEKIDGFNTDVFFDETMRFISENKEDPFFVYLATNVPHGPMNVRQEWREAYDNVEFELRERPWGDTKDLFATLTRFDQNIGRLRDFLKSNNIDKNTILIFLTDNGSANGTHIFNDGMRGGKGSLYDGGHRVPLFIHWPAGGIDKPTDIDRLTAHIDLLPTLIDLCNLNTPDRGHLKLDGRSLAALIKDKNSAWEDRLIINHVQNVVDRQIKDKSSIVYTERWRMINKKQLYDIKEDPSQKNNVAAQNPEVISDLSNKYDAYWTELDMDNNPYPRAIIGSENQEVIDLNSYNWIKGVSAPHSYHQRHVLTAVEGIGFWPVEIAKTGKYQLDVRRWPKELDHPISAGLPANSKSDISVLGKPVVIGEGVAIPTSKVRLKVGDKVLEKAIGEGDVSAVFEMILAEGKINIEAWLIDSKGREKQAYFVYVKPIK
jgi:arylsulfatase B